MAMLTRIKDPLRLMEGDIVILPADYSGRRRLKTHLSLNTLGKFGISIGRTCRSENDSDIVKNWLVDKPEETRYFIVAHAWVSETDSTRRKYASLITNDNRKELVPRVSGISIVKIATPGEDASLPDVAQFCNTSGWKDIFDAMSKTFFSGELVFSRYREGGDTLLDDLFDQTGVKTPSTSVPSCYRPLDGKLTASEVSDSFGGIINGMYDPSIKIPAKAVVALAEHGYVFARPDAAFTNIMARSCVRVLLTEAVKGWRERRDIFVNYMNKVHLMANTVNRRLKAYDSASKRCWVKTNERRKVAALVGKVIE